MALEGCVAIWLMGASGKRENVDSGFGVRDSCWNPTKSLSGGQLVSQGV